METPPFFRRQRAMSTCQMLNELKLEDEDIELADRYKKEMRPSLTSIDVFSSNLSPSRLLNLDVDFEDDFETDDYSPTTYSPSPYDQVTPFIDSEEKGYFHEQYNEKVVYDPIEFLMDNEAVKEEIKIKMPALPISSPKHDFDLSFLAEPKAKKNIVQRMFTTPSKKREKAVHRFSRARKSPLTANLKSEMFNNSANDGELLTPKKRRKTPKKVKKIKICMIEGCTKNERGTTRLCVKHGGGKRCKFEGGCNKGARPYSDFCSGHGGGIRCSYDGCSKGALNKTQFCRKHGKDIALKVKPSSFTLNSVNL